MKKNYRDKLIQVAAVAFAALQDELIGEADILHVSSRQVVFQDIVNERAKQDKKWGVQNHTRQEWVLILQEEIGSVARVLNKRMDNAKGVTK